MFDLWSEDPSVLNFITYAISIFLGHIQLKTIYVQGISDLVRVVHLR